MRVYPFSFIYLFSPTIFSCISFTNAPVISHRWLIYLDIKSHHYFFSKWKCHRYIVINIVWPFGYMIVGSIYIHIHIHIYIYIFMCVHFIPAIYIYLFIYAYNIHIYIPKSSIDAWLGFISSRFPLYTLLSSL